MTTFGGTATRLETCDRCHGPIRRGEPITVWRGAWTHPADVCGPVSTPAVNPVRPYLNGDGR